MKILVVGSRSIDHINIEKYIPRKATLIISGGAGGVDTLAEKFADKKRLSKMILRPKYDLYGKAAPLLRNQCMVDIADAVLVMWDGISKGTKHTADYAKKKNKHTVVILQKPKNAILEKALMPKT